MKVAVLIDGGFLRVVTRKAGRRYDPDFIEHFAHACKTDEEQIQRILYYDCPPFAGTVELPVSGQEKVFESNDAWLHALSYKDLFAVRRGVLKFRGFVLRKKPNPKLAPPWNEQFSDDDFKPEF